MPLTNLVEKRPTYLQVEYSETDINLGYFRLTRIIMCNAISYPYKVSSMKNFVTAVEFASR